MSAVAQDCSGEMDEASLQKLQSRVTALEQGGTESVDDYSIHDSDIGYGTVDQFENERKVQSNIPEPFDLNKLKNKGESAPLSDLLKVSPAEVLALPCCISENHSK